MSASMRGQGRSYGMPSMRGQGQTAGMGKQMRGGGQTNDSGLTNAIHQQPNPISLTDQYAQMMQQYQQALQAAQGNWGQMLGYQNQQNALIDPYMGQQGYSQLLGQQGQMQGLVDPNMGLQQHQQQMANFAPVQQRSQAYYGYGY